MQIPAVRSLEKGIDPVQCVIPECAHSSCAYLHSPPLPLSSPSQLPGASQGTRTSWVGVLAAEKVHLGDGWVGGQLQGKSCLA